jgi:hypothetical protein
VAYAVLKIVGVGAGHLGALKGECVAQVVGRQGRDPAGWIPDLGVVPAADLLPGLVDRAHREASFRGTGRNPVRAEEQRRHPLAGVAGTLLLDVVGDGQAGILQ